MAEFAPERAGHYEIVDVGGRPTAMFATFAIPAKSKADAERRANMAVARGRMNSRETESAFKQRLVDFAKAKETAAKQIEDRAKGLKL